MTIENFRRFYEDWGTDDQFAARMEAAITTVPDERVIVVGFPLGDGTEWTLRLESDRPSFDEQVVVLPYEQPL